MSGSFGRLTMSGSFGRLTMSESFDRLRTSGGLGNRYDAPRIGMKGAAGPEGESLKERLAAGRWPMIVPTGPLGCNR